MNFQHGRDMNINDVFFTPFLPRDFSTLGMNVLLFCRRVTFFAGASNFVHVNGYQMLFRKRKGVFSQGLGFLVDTGAL